MLVKLDNDILNQAVKTVVNVAGTGEEGLIFFKVTGPNILRISSVNKGKGVALYVPCEVEDKSEFNKFAIEPKSFQQAIAGKKEVKIKISESTITLTGARLKADLVTTAAQAERVLPEEVKNSKDTVKVSKEIIEFIGKNLDAIALKPTLETYSYMPVALKVTEKGAIMVCYDNWHMAFATSKEVTGELELTIPTDSLSLLAKEFHGKSYKMQLTEAALYAYNDSFELALPLPQQDSQNVIPAEEAFKLAKIIREQEGVKVFLAAEDVKELATNMESIYKKGEHVDFKVEKEECKVMLKSTHGKIVCTARCKSDKPIQFRTGFGFLRDTLSKVTGKKIEAQVVPDKMLFFNSENKTFMLALLAKEGE